MHPVVDVSLQVKLELQTTVGLEFVLRFGAHHLRVGALLGMLKQLSAIGPGYFARHASETVLVEVAEHVIGQHDGLHFVRVELQAARHGGRRGRSRRIRVDVYLQRLLLLEIVADVVRLEYVCFGAVAYDADK